jgi:hypothetical protein
MPNPCEGRELHPHRLDCSSPGTDSRCRPSGRQSDGHAESSPAISHSIAPPDSPKCCHKSVWRLASREPEMRNETEFLEPDQEKTVSLESKTEVVSSKPRINEGRMIENMTTGAAFWDRVKEIRAAKIVVTSCLIVAVDVVYGVLSTLARERQTYSS